MSIDAIATIEREAERFASALAATDPAQQVPTCPDWTAADLLWHLVEVHEFWAAVLSTGATAEEEVEAIESGLRSRPEGTDALLERREAATASLLAQLEARSDEDPAWFWFSERQDVGVTRRMQTHEATIHRVDAELTAGRPVTPLGSEIAAAGLEHVLHVMWPSAFDWIPEWAEARPVAVVEIRPEGGPTRLLGISRWSGTRPRDGQEFDEPVGRLLTDPAEAEGLPRATVSGPALALDLWAWGRARALDHLAGVEARVGIHGDSEAISQLEGLIAEGHD
ncbi:maleylpyruvate isomerase family mycothiol-dependent enzyme [Brachybacterium sp. AOP43-C2-M15]|uniref:maleylpyruvate isomerase family mycothiol-dependent enzyme n=1 Tax=Brachybacterium sp. AOP43-C2-M15 TaxID=3457661 RepID=UPI0040338D5E